MIDQIKPGCGLEVDGGIDATTAPLAVAAGADVLVAGSAIFNDSESVTAAMQRLRAAASALTEKNVMQLGMIGLGRMGANMVRRLLKGGHQCVVFDMSPKAVRGVGRRRRRSAPRRWRTSCRSSTKPRAVWLMVPAAVVDKTIADLLPHLESGDILIDGGNSYYVDDIRRAKELAPKGIHYVDVGTSGGVWGLERGYCMMIGGRRRPCQAPRSDLHDAGARHRRHSAHAGPREVGGTAEQGYLHCGPNGAGHFVKMVHNGIEYGIMAAYAEGIGILRHANVGKQAARDRCRDDAAARSRALSIRLQPAATSPRSGGAAA